MQIQIITQIHSSYERLCPFERVAIERWRALNPSIRYQFITDKDIDPFIAEHWPQHVSTYHRMMPICRAGVQRLAAVYRWGGLYTDCGSYPLRPVADFRPSTVWDNDIVLFKLRDRDGYPPMVTDCMFAATAGHYHAKGLIEEIFRRSEDVARKAACIEGNEFNYKLYVFETASVHAWSDYARANSIEAVDGLADATGYDLAHHTDRVNIMRFSTESWVKRNRWAENNADRLRDEMGLLNALKAHAGI